MSSAASPADRLPTEWVEQLFRKLAVRYGRAFLSRWEGIDIADVHADWAEQLAGFAGRPECIRHALDNLPPDSIPNAAQFRRLCSSMPDEHQVFRALPLSGDPMPADVRAKFAALLSRARVSA